ncbi:hypothetical protein EC968_006170 [Mortierella alpina]|nr:hypothetical protein EC968_006170 [Mortierella alpina]
MAFNQKRASTSSSASFTASVNPRRQSSYGHIMAGTGGLPSAHTAAIKSSIAAAASSPSSSSNSNGSKHSNGSKRLSGLHLLNPLHSQHRNRSLKARIGRACPSLIHGSPRRRRSLWIMLCAGGIVVLIYFLSAWDVKTSVMDRSSFSSSSFSSRGAASTSEKQPQPKLAQRNIIYGREPTVVYKNPDGSEMDAKSIFMIRDFGLAQCQHAFAGAEKNMPQEVRLERERMRDQSWKSTSRADAWRHSLAWKRSLKRILPNWKEYNAGWVGQGVVLTGFQADALKIDPLSNTLLIQIKLIRSLSSIPIEVWFERAADVSEELQETFFSWGAIVRSLDDNRSTVQDAVVQSSDTDAAAAPTGSLELPIRTAEIQEVKSRIGSSHPAQLHKALTVAALINSGFEDMIYFAPSTLPTMSPRLAFQHQGYLGSGAMFWQHPTSFPAHDSPIWPIVQADCISTAYEQSWSAFALKHKDSWKGLFLAWYWLTGPEAATYEKLFGEQAGDLLRLAWVAVGRPYSIVERMPEAGLLDLSRAKGEGLGCSVGATLYPAAGSPVLEDPVTYLKDQRQHQRLFQQSYRYGTHDDFFIENTNVMMVDAGSVDRHLYKALDRALGTKKDPTRLMLTDAYAAGPEGKVCLRITRTAKGHRHE